VKEREEYDREAGEEDSAMSRRAKGNRREGRRLG
jgi:hypothetical protein